MFRFWLGHTKKMTYDHNLIEISHMFWDFTEDIICLQNIGLKDKKGNSIFEGDILKCKSPNDGNEYITDFNVCMVNGITFKNQSLALDLDLYGYELPDDIEIIGNVFENKELIC